ncbi:MAG: hypothetical protein WKF88_11915 [Ferruginibacter sp.]
MIKRKMQTALLIMTGLMVSVLFSACAEDKKTTEVSVDSKESMSTTPAEVKTAPATVTIDTTAQPRPLKPGN